MGKVHENLSRRMRRTKDEYRDRIDLLRSRVNLLTGEDKLLMTMYLDNGNSFRQLARLAGVNDTNIARRINSITKRLIDGKHIICLRNCDKFTMTEMSIVKEYFLLGFSLKEIAAKRLWTYYRARKTIRKIQQRIKDSVQED